MLHAAYYLARFSTLSSYMSAVTLLALSALMFLVDLELRWKPASIPCALLTWLLGSWVPMVGRVLRIW
jgi:hypothetical protein